VKSGFFLFKLHLSGKEKIICILLILSLAANAYFAYQESGVLKPQQDFGLLSPKVAWLDVDTFLAERTSWTISYQPLKPQINETLSNAGRSGDYGVYFEDLTTGAWMGINEKKQYLPMSLLKVPTMIAVLKKVEKGEVSLDQVVTLEEQDLNAVSGSLYKKGAGYNITVRDLLHTMIKESDNTALLTFNRRFLTYEELEEAKTAIGIRADNETDTTISPKGYSNILRALYLSTYTRRPFSQIALSIMSDTDYNSQIPAGVPENVKVAHKVGFDANGGIYHDCGIVYVPNKPYLLCVMSKGTTFDEANQVISEISKKTYDYVEKELAKASPTPN
jgi:beta-lactamase class A